MLIRWTPDAVSDLQSISAYIEDRTGLPMANRVTRTIYASAQSLRLHPRRGRPGRVSGTRELVLPGLPYVVVYRVSEESVRILNVLHTSRDWTGQQEND